MKKISLGNSIILWFHTLQVFPDTNFLLNCINPLDIVMDLKNSIIGGFLEHQIRANKNGIIQLDLN